MICKIQSDSTVVKWCIDKLRKLRGSGPFGLIPVNNGNRASVNEKKSIREKWIEYLKDVFNRVTVTGNDLENNEKVWHNLEVKEDLFCWEKLQTVIKGLINNKASGFDSVVNDFCNIVVGNLEIN